MHRSELIAEAAVLKPRENYAAVEVPCPSKPAVSLNVAPDLGNPLAEGEEGRQGMSLILCFGNLQKYSLFDHALLALATVAVLSWTKISQLPRRRDCGTRGMSFPCWQAVLSLATKGEADCSHSSSSKQ